MESKSSAESEQIGSLLRELRLGNRDAESKLIALLYPSLRRLAGRFMRGERRGHTLQATALVNEAYIRLAGAAERDWQDRAHFFAAAGSIMRRILVDYGRRKVASKRGGARRRVDLDELLLAARQDLDTMLLIDGLLSELEQVDPRLCRVVESLYFAGMTDEETAEVLGISPVTVKRDWKLAKAWLYEEITRRQTASQ